MKKFLEEAATQHHPLRILREFLNQELANEQAKKYDDLRFVGYVLDIGYDSATIITADRFKINVGGVPRNSLLIMTPSNLESLPLHFTMLRVLESAPTPLSKEVQQTYFELQKKSMPELDVFTQSELQWGALKTEVLGMFYEHIERENTVEFSGDVNNFVSAHKYRVYAPDNKLLCLIINSLVPDENRFELGDLRLTECRLGYKRQQAGVKVFVSANDLKGCRTAMFGKTRLGKSNVVKLIAQGILEATKVDKSVGQLIFDINGEYANDNPQDNDCSIRSAYADRTEVYALTKRAETPSKPLRLNFYERPESCIGVIKSLLEKDSRNSDYIRSFANVELPSIESILSLPQEKRDRSIRKIQIYWAILHKAGFPTNPSKLTAKGLSGYNAKNFNPNFSKPLREAAYKFAGEENPPEHPTNLDELVSELEVIGNFAREKSGDKALKSTSSGDAILDASDMALLRFLSPTSNSSGPIILRAYLTLHSADAGNFIEEILSLLDNGKTVILDLGNATDAIRRYFSDMLSWEVFGHQEKKFVSNKLGRHYIQLYFEEAHNLFPQNDDVTTIYSRFAKEGAKYHVGMVYSTQSPTTINRDLLAQTENFFIAHLSSQDQVNALGKVNVAYESLKGDILQAKTPGYMRMLTRSHRFVVSVQARKFVPPNAESNGSLNGRS
ncbi:DUF87 domain-containing protein [Microcystis aeruginosa CS-564/01]|uniref:ATP-binding protein n=1 Tax=Microcystis aeruginosa TaxID=1126 RepID=UPI00232CD92B|nr:DUF87 domain-containing protein [Microcystis aeruginosa]MDB9426946.1 DUF87 domain-containing protein [Microcystis aeruginosa CS-564/01]